MRIIVCGAGLVGSSIARQLAAENNDVTIVDQSPETIQKMNESLDVRAIEGYASHPDVLEQAVARDAEMIVAVTQNDEINMVACQVAHSLFETPTKIARIRAQTYLDPAWQNLFSRNHLPIDVIISPEIEVARAITSRLNVPGATDMVSFVDDRVRVVAVSIGDNCPIVDTPLRQLTELFPDLHMRIVGIVRREGIITPGGDDQILVGDEVYFTVDTTQVQRAMSTFGHEEKEARRIVVIGGGNIGLFVSKQIIEGIQDVRLKMIEVSRGRAESVADQLERAVVIYGDSLAAEILAEANVKEADAVIAVTNDDQVNILSSLLAKREGAKRATTLVNNMTYGPLVR